VKVVVADDHRLMVDALSLVFSAAAGIELVGTTTEGRKVLPLVARTRPDVAVLDAYMPDLDGLVCLDRIRERYPSVAVVIISGSDDPELAADAERRGARAFVSKQVDPRELPEAVLAAARGPAFRALGLEQSADRGGLTPKELDVLALLVRGFTNREIARELWLAEQTVKFHLGNIYRKLGAANRTEATRHALSRSLVRLD